MTTTPKTCRYCGMAFLDVLEFPPGLDYGFQVVCRACKARGPIKTVRDTAVDAWNKPDTDVAPRDITELPNV